MVVTDVSKCSARLRDTKWMQCDRRESRASVRTPPTTSTGYVAGQSAWMTQGRVNPLYGIMILSLNGVLFGAAFGSGMICQATVKER